MSTERIPMSREGYEKLKADLDRMQNTEMIAVAKRIAAARDLGDLSGVSSLARGSCRARGLRPGTRRRPSASAGVNSAASRDRRSPSAAPRQRLKPSVDGGKQLLPDKGTR